MQEPLTPELFPGYRAMMAAELRRLSLSSQQAEVLTKQVNELAKQRLAQPYTPPVKPIKEQGILERLFAPGPAKLAYLYAVTGEPLNPTTPEQDAAFRQIGIDLTVQNSIAASARWRVLVLDILPGALQTSKVPINSVDDLVRSVGTAAPLTNEDRQFAQQLIDTLTPKITQVVAANNGKPANSADTARILAELQKPTGSFSKLYSINPDRMSIEEVVSTFSLANRFELPKGVADAAVLRAILRAQQVPEDEIQRQFDDVAAEIAAVVKQGNIEQAQYAAIIQGGKDIAEGRITSLIEKARWEQAASRPLSIVLKPLEFYAKYWTPVYEASASIGLQFVSRAGLIPGAAGISSSGQWESLLADRKGVTLTEHYRKARESGASYFRANQLAWEEWDTNAAVKFAAEVLFDPMTYVGFGLYTKVFSALPVIGRFTGGAVGAVEKGFNLVGNIPFMYLREGLNLLPKTLSQKATVHVTQFFDDFRLGFERAYEIPVMQASPAQLKEFAARAVTIATDNPLSPDIATRSGLWLLGRRTISAREVSKLLADMGIDDIVVTPELLQRVQVVQEFTDGISNSKFLSPERSAPLILEALRVLDSADNINTVAKFLADTKASMIRKALNHFDQTESGKILTSMLQGYKDDFLAAEHVSITNDRLMLGLIDRALTTFDTKQRAIFTAGIGHYVTIPFARAYLLFAGFGPLNVVEMSAKGMLAVGNPLLKGLTATGKQSIYNQQASRYLALEADVPIEWLRPGQFVQQAQLPTQTREVLAGKTILTPKQEAAVERSTQNIVEHILAPVRLQRLGGPISYEQSARTGNAMAADLGGQLYDRELVKRAPDLHAQTVELVQNASRDYENHVSHETAEAYRNEFALRMATGIKQHIRNIVTDFNPNVILGAEVNKLAEQAVLIYDVVADPLIAKANAGTLFAKGAQGIVAEMALMESAIRERSFTASKLFSANFKSIMEGFAADIPTTVSGVNEKVAFLDAAAQAYGELIDEQMASLVVYAEKHANPLERAVVYNQMWTDRILPFTSNTGRDIVTSIQGLKKQLGLDKIVADMPLAQRESYLAMVENMLAQVSDVRLAWERVDTLRAEFFLPTGSRYVGQRQRGSAFWDAYKYEKQLIWEPVNRSRFTSRATNMRLATSLPGYIMPTPVNAANRPLTAKDVALLWGSNPNDLVRSMYMPERQMMRTKDDFVSLVRDSANNGAPSGMTADTLGYTEEAVGKVYDSIMFSMGKDLEPAMIQLKNLGDELIRLARTKDALVSPEFSAVLQRTADELVGREATTRIIPEIPERVIPEVTRTELTTGEQMLIKQEGGLLERLVSRKEQDEVEQFIQDVIIVEQTSSFGTEATRREADLRAIWDKPSATFDPNLRKVDWNDEPKWELKLANLADATAEPSTQFILQPNIEQLADDMDAALVDALTQSFSDASNRTRIAELERQGFDLLRQLRTHGKHPDDLRHNFELALDNLLVISKTGRYSKEAAARFLSSAQRELRSLLDASAVGKSELRRAVEQWFTEEDNDALQTLGKLAASNQAYKESIQQILKQRYPSGHIRIYRGSGKAKRTGLDPLEREFTNVTASKKTAKEFEPVNDSWAAEEKLYYGLTGKQPEITSVKGTVSIDSVIIRAKDVVSIASAKESELIIPSSVLRDRMANPIIVPDITETIVTKPGQIIPGTPQRTRKVPAVPGIVDVPILPDGTTNLTTKLLTPEYQTIRSEAAKAARQEFFLTLPDYTHQNVLNGLMRAIFPFFTYESHRWQYLPRTFIQKPGVFGGWMKYQDNSDKGYIHIPGTSLDFSPVRGTILGGPLSRLMNREYPTYYDQFPGLGHTVDTLERFGFFPGAAISIPMALFGAKYGLPQTGQILPASFKTLLETAIAAAPEQAQILTDTFFPDRYRDMLVAIQVGVQGGEGIDILTRKLSNEPVTAEEQKLWDRASRSVALSYGIMSEQTGMFRLRPEEVTAVRAAANEVISKMTGIPVSSLEDIYKAGLRLEDVLPPLSPDVHRALNALEGWSRLTGASIGLQPSGLQRHSLAIRRFWQDVVTRNEVGKQELLELERAVKEGRATIEQWSARNVELKRENRNYLESHHAEPRYSEVPITLDERKADRLKYGLEQPTFAAIQELQQLYYAQPLENWTNPDTGIEEPNWDKYFAYQAAIEQSVPENQMLELRDLNTANYTPWQLTQYNVSREYFRAYNAVYTTVLNSYTPEEQRLIKRFSKAQTPAERAEIQAVVSSGGGQLISEFNTKVRTAHENLREVDSELDAWLLFFQKVSTPKTAEAASRLEAIRNELGIVGQTPL